MILKKGPITDWWNDTYLSLAFIHCGTSQNSLTQPWKWLHRVLGQKNFHHALAMHNLSQWVTSQSSLHTRKRVAFIKAKGHQGGKSCLFWSWISLFDQCMDYFAVIIKWFIITVFFQALYQVLMILTWLVPNVVGQLLSTFLKQ